MNKLSGFFCRSSGWFRITVLHPRSCRILPPAMMIATIIAATVITVATTIAIIIGNRSRYATSIRLRPIILYAPVAARRFTVALRRHYR